MFANFKQDRRIEKQHGEQSCTPILKSAKIFLVYMLTLKEVSCCKVDLNYCNFNNKIAV